MMSDWDDLDPDLRTRLADAQCAAQDAHRATLSAPPDCRVALLADQGDAARVLAGLYEDEVIPRLTGGPLHDMACHALNWASWLVIDAETRTDPSAPRLAY